MLTLQNKRKQKQLIGKYNLFVQSKFNHMLFIEICTSERYLVRCYIHSLNTLNHTLIFTCCITMYKKFELMLTRHTKAYSSSGSIVLAGNWAVHTKLINKYQILHLYRIMIVPWCHLVNDIDLCRSPKSPKNA